MFELVWPKPNIRIALNRCEPSKVVRKERTKDVKSKILFIPHAHHFLTSFNTKMNNPAVSGAQILDGKATAAVIRAELKQQLQHDQQSLNETYQQPVGRPLLSIVLHVSIITCVDLSISRA